MQKLFKFKNKGNTLNVVLDDFDNFIYEFTKTNGKSATFSINKYNQLVFKPDDYLNLFTREEYLILISRIVKSKKLDKLYCNTSDSIVDIVKFLGSYSVKGETFSAFSISEFLVFVTQALHNSFFINRDLNMDVVLNVDDGVNYFKLAYLRFGVYELTTYDESNKLVQNRFNYVDRKTDYKLTPEFLYNYSVIALSYNIRLKELHKCLKYVEKISLDCLKHKKDLDEIVIIAFYESLKFFSYEFTYLEARYAARQVGKFKIESCKNGDDYFGCY